MKRASKSREGQAVGRSVPTCCSPFKSGTGLMGFTESGQRVTADNAHFLPAGSVVRLDDGGRLIHLHDGLWLYCTDCSWCYDRIEHHLRRLPGTLCHIPANPSHQPPPNGGRLDGVVGIPNQEKA